MTAKNFLDNAILELLVKEMHKSSSMSTPTIKIL